MGPGSLAEAGRCPVAGFTHFPEPGPSRSSPLRGSITPAFLRPRRSPAGKVGQGRWSAHSRGLAGRVVRCSPGHTWSVPSGCTRALLHLCSSQEGGQGGEERRGLKRVARLSPAAPALRPGLQRTGLGSAACGAPWASPAWWLAANAELILVTQLLFLS